MSFRRTGHSDERRRRVLRDEVRGSAGEDETGEAAETSGKKRGRAAESTGQRYSAAALANRQPPVTCLIAKRGWVLVALAFLGLSIVAGLETLYTHVYCRLPAERQALCPALDVDRAGSLVAWWAALLLAIGAAGSLMVYAIRRHRLDDYRARYRVWLWAACAFLLGSADAATGLHVGLGRLAVELQGERLQLSEQLWSWGILGVVFGLAGLRLLVEMRSSYSAVAMMLAALAVYATAGCVVTGVLSMESQPLSSALYSTCLLVGHGSLLLGVLCYARCVYHDAQGGATPRARKATRKNDTDPGEPAASRSRQPRTPRNVRVDAAHSTDGSKAKTSATAPIQFVPSPPQAEDEDEDEDTLATGDQSHMSRSERRRLRKQMRRQGSSDG